MTIWIQQMKSNPRGPFDGIFWFCKDGSVLPPAPYACAPYGGGIQHGRWNERTRPLRDAGILTLEAGNLVSHVQLLAGNLGIPNVVVDRTLLPRLRPMAGRKAVLAVSPGGRVILAEDGPRWDAVFGQAARPAAGA